jgi:UDP-N-acetylglucosamine--N-acetylmuramyl-(pentapeptide) pyrophosphoryl-undecaprenol N-acetylglucosamine transferase
MKLIDLWKSRLIINEFRPDVVIGTGNLQVGHYYKLRIIYVPTLVQEQNSYPGITNKLLVKSRSIIGCV